jgi:ubiquinone/menaquinone biosynthesis C-methylase UbiE
MVAEEQQQARSGWRFPPERRQDLWTEDRTKRMPPEPVLAQAGIGPGMSVLDIGAGTGYWTLPLSRMVGPDGRVFAVDVEPLMIEDLHALVREHGLSNVEVVQSGELAIPLGDEVADVAVLGFVLHEPPDLLAFLHEMARLLVPGGRILVVEWHKRETEFGPPVDHRVSEDEARELLEAAGFSALPAPSPHEDLYVILGTF